MKVNEYTRRMFAVRREIKAMRAAGYRDHETDWEIHRGHHTGEIIIDAKVSVDGMRVWTKIGAPTHE